MIAKERYNSLRCQSGSWREAGSRIFFTQKFGVGLAVLQLEGPMCHRIVVGRHDDVLRFRLCSAWNAPSLSMSTFTLVSASQELALGAATKRRGRNS